MKETCDKITIKGCTINKNLDNASLVKLLLMLFDSVRELEVYTKQLRPFIGKARFGLIRGTLYTKLYKKASENVLKSKPKLLMASKPSENKTKEVITYQSYEVIEKSVTSSGTIVTVINGDKRTQLLIPSQLKLVPSKVLCVGFNDKLIIDEYWLYKQCELFKKGSDYIFEVKSCKKQVNGYRLLLKDRFGHEQELVSQFKACENDQIVCEIMDYRKPKKHLMCLVLTKPRMHKIAISEKRKSTKSTMKPAHYYPNGKGPDVWYREVRHLDHHTATNPFKCSCCGGNFSARQGCKVELRDIYFCKSCADHIFKKSDKGYLRIVYTPMGNKR